MLAILTCAKHVRRAFAAMLTARMTEPHAQAVATYLALAIDRLGRLEQYSMYVGTEKTGGAKIRNTFARQALPMVWDFAESAIFGEATGSLAMCLDWVVKGTMSKLGRIALRLMSAEVQLPNCLPSTRQFDAIITDPPYYDNVSYSNLSDFFYVWLKRTVGHLYPEHFSAVLTPKKKEAIAAFYRHDGKREAAPTSSTKI